MTHLWEYQKIIFESTSCIINPFSSIIFFSFSNEKYLISCFAKIRSCKIFIKAQKIGLVFISFMINIPPGLILSIVFFTNKICSSGLIWWRTSITVTTSNLSSGQSKKVEIFLYLTLLKTVFTASKSVSITSTPYKIFGFLKIAIKYKKTPSPQPISKTLLLLGILKINFSNGHIHGLAHEKNFLNP